MLAKADWMELESGKRTNMKTWLEPSRDILKLIYWYLNEYVLITKQSLCDRHCHICLQSRKCRYAFQLFCHSGRRWDHWIGKHDHAVRDHRLMLRVSCIFDWRISGLPIAYRSVEWLCITLAEYLSWNRNISLSIYCYLKQKYLCNRRSNIYFLQGWTYWCCRDKSHHCCSYTVGWTDIAGNSWPTCLRASLHNHVPELSVLLYIRHHFILINFMSFLVLSSYRCLLPVPSTTICIIFQ